VTSADGIAPGRERGFEEHFMKKILFLIFFAVAVGHAAVSPMTQARLAGFLAGGAAFDFILVDLRTIGEIDAVIGNNSCRPYHLAWPEPFMRESARIPKNRAVVVYCGRGGRAEAAANYLASKGYERVYNAGGMMTWNGATLPPSGIKPLGRLPEPSMRAVSRKKSAAALEAPLFPATRPAFARPVTVLP
jgi:rhodanese-related sulfurtransferase